MSMRVGIVGAGVCGLAAARELSSAGFEAVVFEKNSRVGGRVSTFRQDGFVWDTGATSIAPRGMAIADVLLSEGFAQGLTKVEKPIYTHRSLRVLPGDSKRHVDRYTYEQGIAEFARLLSLGLDVRLQQQVETIERDGDGFVMMGERFQFVILTPPIPRASVLLWSLGESRSVANVFYRACINIALGYDRDLPDLRYHAILDPEQRHPLTWLSLESIKSRGRAPSGCSAMCAQMSPRFSADHYEDPDTKLIETAAFFVSRIYGADFGKPSSATVKRWKYSQPETVGSVTQANPEGTRLLLASDGLLGGRIENAYEVGLQVARRVIASA
jgi:renalase